MTYQSRVSEKSAVEPSIFTPIDNQNSKGDLAGRSIKTKKNHEFVDLSDILDKLSQDDDRIIIDPGEVPSPETEQDALEIIDKILEEELGKFEKTQAKIKRTAKEKLESNLALAIEQQKNEDKNFYFSHESIPSSPFLSFNYMDKKIPWESTTFTLGTRQIGVASTIGERSAMEDTFLVESCTFKAGEEIHSADVFAVFDGHNGAEASLFVKANWITYAKRALEQHNAKELTEEGICFAFKDCCQKLHDDLPAKTAATTAAVVMIFNGYIWNINVGDSRSVLVGEETIQMSQDAKPQIDRFAKTIHKRGGSINYWDHAWRVNSQIGVARVIGDKYVVNKHTGKWSLSCKPVITRFPLDKLKNPYIAIGSDGLFDEIPSKGLGDIIKCMDKNKESVEIMSQKVLYSAYSNESQDNITVIIVKLF